MTCETSCASTARSGKSPQLRQCIGSKTQGRCQPTHNGTGVNRVCRSSIGRRQTQTTADVGSQSISRGGLESTRPG